MSVEIREVKTRKELKQFVQFANDLYKDCVNYCPPLFVDELSTFDRKKNPSYDITDSICFLALRDGVVVGRIAGIINYRANEHWNVKKCRFGWFDFIDDMEVSSALLDAVAAWGKSKNMELLNGPVGFTDLDHEGLLIEGFEYLAPMASLYTYPYYIQHFEHYGLEKEADWIEFQMDPTQVESLPEKVIRGAEIAKQRYHLHVDKIKNAKELVKKYGTTYFDVIDEAYSVLYNFQPLTARQKEFYSNFYFSLLNFDFVTLVVDDQNAIVGVGVAMPDISYAMRKSGGKLFPFGWYHLLKALKAKQYDAIDLLLIAVRPDYQARGVNGIIMVDQFPYYKQYKVTRVETTSILETNWKNQANWKIFPNKQHKRRRAYLKRLSE